MAEPERTRQLLDQIVRAEVNEWLQTIWGQVEDAVCTSGAMKWRLPFNPKKKERVMIVNAINRLKKEHPSAKMAELLKTIMKAVGTRSLRMHHIEIWEQAGPHNKRGCK
ncbi:MAG: hypothetical protein SGPRY_008006, partial [Prymnesium sp.]